MSMLYLLLSRQALAAGVGMTTRRNNVLPAPDVMTPIPARVGRDKPGTPEPDVLIAGDVYEPPYPAESWAPSWYVDSAKLVSTDGLFSLDKSQWKRWTGRTASSGDVYAVGSGPLAHFNFSSPATAAVVEPSAGSTDLQFTEGPWSERTWHPRRSALFARADLTGIVQRLKTLTFRATGSVLPSAGMLLTWSFSDDDTAASSVTDKPAYINKSGDEQGLSSRELLTVNAPHIRRLNLTINSKQATLRTETPYGFLPTVKEAKANSWTGSSTIYYANDLAKINILGQAFHGLGLVSGGLKNGSYPMRNPPGYQSAPTCNTRYTKIPGLPVPPDPSAPENSTLYPADFIAAGDRYYNDIVWFGGRRYGTSVNTNSLELSDLHWIHVDDAGVARVLSLSYVGRTASTTTWTVRNHGPLQFGAGIGVAVPIGTITITTTSAEAIAQYTGLNTTTKVAYQTGSPDVQGYSTSYALSSRLRRKNGYVLATTHPLAHSPNGRQIAVFRGVWYRDFSAADKYKQYIDNIHTVATFNISSDLTVSGPTDVFQWEAKYPTDRVTTFSYESYDSTHDSELATTTMTPYTDRVVRLITYRPDGSLCLVVEESRVEAASGTKNVGLRSIPYTPREPMAYPSEIQTDYNMKRDVITIKGFGADGLGSIVGGVGLIGQRTTSARMSNNVLYAEIVVDGSNPATFAQEFITPLGHVGRDTIFGGVITGGASRYCSYNPRTNEVGGVNSPYVAGDDYVAYISWI